MHMGTTGRFEGRIDFDIGKFFYYCFLFWSLFLLIDPFYFGYGAFRVTRDLGPLKYFGLMFGFAALFFALLGQAINVPREKQPPWRANLAYAWPILLFGVIVLAGSATARLHFGIKETFLPMAFGIVGFPLGVILFWVIGDGLLVARRFLQGLLLVLPVVIGWVVAKRIEGGQAFHTEIFLFVPLSVYFFLMIKRRWLAWVILLSAVVLGIASHKNTAYLVLAITLLHLLLLGISKRQKIGLSIKRLAVIYGLFLLLMLGTSLVGYLLVNKEEYLPSGNVEAREITYGAAIDRFFDSPIWGTGFAETTLVQLTGLTVLGNDTLVSHSDMLDVLSHGGLIGALLLAFGLYRVFFRAVSVLRSPVDTEIKSLVHGLGVIVVCGIITATFNSPLITLPIGVLFWFSFGLLAAVSDFGRGGVSLKSKGD